MSIRKFHTIKNTLSRYLYAINKKFKNKKFKWTNTGTSDL